MPQVSPLPFTGALHVACVICRAPVGWYIECIATVTELCEHYRISGFIKNFVQEGHI